MKLSSTVLHLATIIFLKAQIGVAERPPNDLCEQAIEVDVAEFDVILQGESKEALQITNTSQALSCDGVRPYHFSGVWFFLNGDGSCYSLSTEGSTYDTFLGAYEGDCNALTCVATNDDTEVDKTSELIVETETGKSYYALIASDFWVASQYNLTVTQVDCPRKVSDRCEDAFEINSFPFQEEGNTENSVVLQEAEAPTCKHIHKWNQKGSWYKLAGDGRCFTVSVGRTAFLETLAIYEGDCAGLECHDAYGIRSLFTGEVQVQTNPGQSYYIFLSGYFRWSFGSYSLNVAVKDNCISKAFHEDCVKAKAIESVPFNDKGSTERSKPVAPTEVPKCSHISSWNRKGVFYTLVGDGSNYAVSTAGSSFDTAIAVYEGKCGDLTCIELEGTEESLREIVLLQTEVDKTYTIFITGQGMWPTEFGDFVFSVAGAR